MFTADAATQNHTHTCIHITAVIAASICLYIFCYLHLIHLNLKIRKLYTDYNEDSCISPRGGFGCCIHKKNEIRRNMEIVALSHDYVYVALAIAFKIKQ